MNETAAGETDTRIPALETRIHRLGARIHLAPANGPLGALEFVAALQTAVLLDDRGCQGIDDFAVVAPAAFHDAIGAAIDLYEDGEAMVSPAPAVPDATARIVPRASAWLEAGSRAARVVDADRFLDFLGELRRDVLALPEAARGPVPGREPPPHEDRIMWTIIGHAPTEDGYAPLPRLWSTYMSLAEAEEAAADGEKAERMARSYAPGTVRVASWAEFEKLQKSVLLSDGIMEIDAQKYEEMLSVLPPMNWKRDRGLETFLMSEFLTGSMTHMYARLGDRCFAKLVDVRDKKTWITGDEILAMPEPTTPAM